ncbi:MAG: choice-of-anchor D domain-containing protein [Bacteroidia bacterium]|nr:choice-of-anchor D domain-containing protein [Bacteroidia bacterium]
MMLLSAFATNTLNAANRYWVSSSTSNWNNTSNWSASSGGTSGASVPGAADVAIFDGASGLNGNCNVDANVNVQGFQITGYSGTVAQNAFTVTIGSAGFAQSSGTFTGSSSNITINSTGTFGLSGGAFTSTSGNLSITGARSASQTLFTHSAGTFNHNNGLVTLNPNQPGCSQLTYTVDIISGTIFYDININATPSCGINAIVTTAAGDQMTAANNFSHTDGLLNGSFGFNTNLAVAATADGGTGTIEVLGTGTQTFAYNTGGRTCKINVNKSSGTFSQASGTTDLFCQGFTLQAGTFVAPSGILNIGGTLTTSQTIFSHSAGTFTHNSGTVVLNPFQPACTQLTFTADVISATLFNSVEIKATPSCGINPIVTTASGDELNLVNDFTHTDGVFSGNVSFEGDLFVAAAADGGTGIITADGTGVQQYTFPTGGSRTCQLVVNKASSRLEPASGTTDLSIQSLTIQSGRFVAPSGTLNIGGTWTTSQTLFNHIGGVFSHNTGLVVLNPNQPACTQLTFTADVLNNTQFYDLELKGTPSCGINPIITTGAGDTLDARHNATHTDGIFQGKVSFGNDLVIATTADGGTGMLIADGNGLQQYTFPTGGARTCQLIVDKPSGRLEPATGTTDLSIQALAIVDGRFVAPTGTLNIGGTWTSSQTLFNHIGGVFSHNTGLVVLNPNQPACTQLTFAADVLTHTQFYNLELKGTPSCGINPIITTGAGDTLDARNNATHTDGIFSGKLSFGNDLVIATTADGGTGMLIADGNGLQQYTFPTGGARTCQLIVDKPSGRLEPATGTTDLSIQALAIVDGRFVSPTGTLNIGGTWTTSQTLFNHIGGVFSHNTGLVVLNPNQPACTQLTFTADVLTHTQFYDLELKGTPSCGINPIITTGAGDTLDARHNTTHTDGIFSGKLSFGNDLIIATTADGGTGMLIADGNGLQQYTFPTGGARTCQLIVDKPTGRLEPASGTTDLSIQALRLVNGRFIAPSATLNIGGVWTANQTLFNHIGGVFSHNNGLVALNPNQPACTQLTFTTDVLNSTVFYNFELNGTPSCGINPIFVNAAGDTIDASNNLTYTNGICNAMIAAAGNVVVASTFDGGNGKLLFVGGAAQTFDLTGATNLFNGSIVVDKSSNDVTLQSVCTLDASGQGIQFANGLINSTSTNLMRIDRNVAVTGGNAGSYVNGPLVRMIAFNGASNNVFFPIGAAGDYRQLYLNVTHSAATNYDYTGEVIASSAQALGLTMPSGIDNVSPTRYWQLDRSATGNLTSASVQGFYDGDDGITDPTDLRMVKGNGSGSWVNIGGTGTAVTTGSITSTINFTTFSPFALSNSTGGSNFVTPAEALNFDGTNDYVSIAGGGGLNNLQAGTIEMWVKWKGTQDKGYGNQWGAVLARQSNGVFTNQLIALNGSNPATAKIIWNPYLYNTTALTSTLAAGDDVWNHIAITYSSGSHKMYINGNLVASSTTTGTINNNSSKVLTIGGWIDDGQGYSNSTIDEVRIWNYERTCAQIKSVYNHYLVGNESGLLSYYTFDQGIASGSNSTEDTLYDLTSNSNDGPLNNMALTGSTSNWVEPGSGVTGTTPDPQPEIDVTGNAVAITDGDITPATADHTDFGNISTTGASVRTFTITNSGSADLNISSMTLTGTGASSFTLGSLSPSSPIAPGNSATFTATFAPTTIGTKVATVTINNDDCDEAVYNFNIQGSADTAASLNFDGANDFVTIGNVISSGSSYTKEAWIYRSNTSSGDNNILSSSNEPFWLTGGKLSAANQFSGSAQIQDPVTMSVGTWVHVAVTYDATTSIGSLYKNGTLVASGTMPSVAGGSTQIGAYISSYVWDGNIDEVRVWNRALCQAEIAAHMNCEIPTTGSGLLANYHMNQGVAGGNNAGITTATDATGNGNTGTLSGFGLSSQTSNWITPGGVVTGTSCGSFSVPEIDVTGNAVAIADGDITPATADHTEFGNISTTGASVRTFTITNSGANDLNVSSIALSGTGASSFTLGTLTPASPIAPGNSATFTATFAPTTIGTKVATVTINSDDCDEAAFNFDIQGSADTAAALNLDGTNDYVNMGNPSAITFTKTSQISIEAWIKADASGTGADEQIVSKIDGSFNGYGLQLGVTGGRNGRLEFYLIGNYGANDALWIFSNYASDLRDGNWHHVAATYDGSNTLAGMHVYVDGVDYGSGTTAAGPIAANINTSGNCQIGAYAAGSPNEFFKGNIDEVRIWNRYLCAGEIVAHKDCEIPTTGTNLMVNYHMNQGVANGNNVAITAATDASGNAISGTLTNMASTGVGSNWTTPGGVVTGTSCSPYSAPEIDITGNAVSIADGDLIPTTADHTDFGTVFPSLARVFTITNSGASVLNISSIVVSGTNASDFVVTGAPSSVAAAGSQTFTVTFTPGAYGSARNAIITVNSDDCDEAIYNYAVTGMGQAPSPGGVSTDLSLWTKGNLAAYTDNGVTPATAGQLVQQWNDAYSGKVFSQTTNSLKPTLVNSINFNPTLGFNGSQYMDLTTALGIGGTQNYTYFAVFMPTTINNGSSTDGLGSYILDRQTPTNELVDLKFIGSNSLAHQFRYDNGTGIGTVGTASLPVNMVMMSEQHRVFNSEFGHALNGGVKVTAPSNSNSLVPPAIRLGRHQSNATGGLIGEFAELIVYGQYPTTSELLRINSYLAIKYGVTLDQAVAQDYVNSSGTVLYNSAGSLSTYNNDILGIGRDDVSALDQRQSKSVNPGSILTVGNGNVSTNNASNSNTFAADNSFFVAGHDSLPMNSTGVTDVGTAFNPGLSANENIMARVARIWANTETGTVGTLKLLFDMSGVEGTSGQGTNDLQYVRLLVDADATFATGALSISPSAYNNGTGIVEFDYNFAVGSGFFTIGSINVSAAPLPVKFVDARAVWNQQNSDVSWTVAEETYGSVYTIERSIDGGIFAPVGTVKGKAENGNAFGKLGYTFTDLGVREKTTDKVYYRIRCTEQDGHVAYSQNLVLFNRLENTTSLQVYPNPSNSVFNVKATLAPSTDYTISLKSSTGAIIYSAATGTEHSGSIFQTISAEKLASGMYFIEITGDGYREVRKVFVTR